MQIVLAQNLKCNSKKLQIIQMDFVLIQPILIIGKIYKNQLLNTLYDVEY